MELTALSLTNFRNYAELSLEFHPRLNLIRGLNGQGKTNLLEAIYYLSAFSSFRNGHLEEMIKKDSPYFLIAADYRANGLSHTIKAAYSRDKKRLIKTDGNVCHHLNDVIGSLNCVVFSPDDLLLMKSGPEQRRNFLDREIMQMAPGSYDRFQRYRKCLRQRNNLLKDIRGGFGDATVLDAFDAQLAENGAAILAYRKAAIDRLLPLVRLSHRRLSDGKEELFLRYESGFADDFWKKATLEELEQALLDKLREHRREDIARAVTTCGPHRDDVVFSINGDDLRRFGSQGQQRTAVLALKIGELELMKGHRGEYPILLLDDVLSELDSERRAALAETVNGRVQTFITSTENEHFPGEAKTITIHSGGAEPHTPSLPRI